MIRSFHNSYLCSKLVVAFSQLQQFLVLVEVALQIGNDDYIPDICLYPFRPVNFEEKDVIKMTEMPLTVVEILSPSQTAQDAWKKFDAYFDAGIKSCWLVLPIAKSINVYTSINHVQRFHAGDVIDPASNIRISIDAIFE